jgi:hypothetical protein
LQRKTGKYFAGNIGKSKTALTETKKNKAGRSAKSFEVVKRGVDDSQE